MQINGHYRGYVGGFLRVNLNTKQATLDEKYVQYDVLRQFLGGKGLGSYMLYSELKTDTASLDPGNKMILLTGPLTGSGAVTGCRLTLVSKGPATGLWLDTGAGGFFGPALKMTGYDGIILEGKADKPVYVYIREDQVQILDAQRIWGMNTVETSQVLRATHGEKIHIGAIGPTGERQSKIASVIFDGRAAGRGGMGSVLGSKNVKAIVVEQGKGKIKTRDPEMMKTINKEVRDILMNSPMIKDMGKYG